MRLHTLRRTRIAPLTLDDVVLLAAFRYLGQRHVRHFHEDPRERRFGLRHLGLETTNLLTEGAPRRDHLRDALAGLLPTRHLLRRGVPRGLAFFRGLNEQPPLALQLLAAVELARERAKLTTTPHRLAKLGGALANHSYVVHQFLGIESGTNPPYPQFGAMTPRPSMCRVPANTLSVTNF